MSRLGIVTGLQSEARLAHRAAAVAGLGPDQVAILCLGPGLDRAGQAAEALLAAGATRLVSLGLAGALSPALKPGTLILPQRVLIAGEETAFFAEAPAQAALLAVLEPAFAVTSGDLLTSPAIVASPAEKADLARRQGAIAVDMESAGVAAVAAAAGRPFLALRAIADPAHRAIGPAAAAGMRGDGTVDAGHVLVRLAQAPREVGAVARLALDTARASAALGRAARLALALLVARG